MKTNRSAIFPAVCVLFILFYFMKISKLPVSHLKTQFSHPQLVQSLQSMPEQDEKQINRQINSNSISIQSEKNYTSGLTNIELVLNGEFFPSIITTEVPGWLGNQMGAYASLLYFQKVHGMHAILADWQMNILTAAFQKKNLKIQPSILKMPPQFSPNWEVVVHQKPQGAFFPNEKFLKNIEKYKFNKFLNIGWAPNFLFLYKEILNDIREQLLFKTNIQVLVDQWLADIQLGKKAGKEIIFIGVHCRRGDYAEQLMMLSGAALVDHNYFDRAFDIYRSRYNSPTTQVVFLTVSDDTAWIKENLGKHEDVRFGVDFSQGVVQGNGSGFDLCLMAACNHSIHTYGTYGTWGSLLAGGDVIVPTGINAELNTEEDQIYKRAAIPGWVYLDLRDLDNIKEVKYTPKHS